MSIGIAAGTGAMSCAARTNDVVCAEIEERACELLPDGAKNACGDGAQAVEDLEEGNEREDRGHKCDDGWRGVVSRSLYTRRCRILNSPGSSLNR